MTKIRHRVDNLKQLSLFDYVQSRIEEQQREVLPGQLNIQHQVKALISKALHDTSRSRFEVAARMSELLGQEVSKAMLDAWSAESKEYHRFPAEFIPAFCAATGSRELLRLLAERSGSFCLPGPDALRAEVKRIEEQIQELQDERRKRMTFLREMGGER
jgi:hypothetical protein